MSLPSKKGLSARDSPIIMVVLFSCLLTYDKNCIVKGLRQVLRYFSPRLCHVGASTTASANGFSSRLNNIARMGTVAFRGR